ncbi:hypothetical protein IAR55_000912 [Kwoniella newhampshirensis]|uniref:Uncharacterized protein n=1 Tax=Kwoniella newhampshirensis TaxID=1651941 RepID=A0AAW0Z468_9TREE
MPRTPSPPPRFTPRRSYRDDSPPRPMRDGRDDYRYRSGESSRHNQYDRERDRGGPPVRDRRAWRDDRGDDRDRDRFGGERSWGTYYRDRERDRRTPPPPPPPGGYSRRTSFSNHSDSRGSPMGGRSKSKSRSGTPEEGQITSPVQSAFLPTASTISGVNASGTGLPPRPRSPPRSPPRRRRSRSPLPYHRRYDRESDWGRERERERERDRDRDMDRERDRPYPPSRRSRSPYSPPPRRRRSPSLSTGSTHSRSSRFSPIKRPLSPFERRTRSPEKRPRLASPSPPPRIPPPPPRSQSQLPSQPPTNSPMGPRIPPSGPRSERMPLPNPPTGPRALAHLNNPVPTRPIASRVNPYAPIVKEEPQIPTAETSATSNSPYSRATPTGPSGPGSAPRLSWSERKSIISSSTSVSTPEPQQPPPPPPPTQKPNSTVFNPYASTTTRTPVPHSGGSSPHTLGVVDDIKPKVDQIEDFKPTLPLNAPPPPPPPLPPSLPVINEAELAEKRAKEEETRILAELPALKVGFGGAAWELELANHNHHYQSLIQNTLRAQAAARHAAMVLADAEAERTAAGERRRICESQLMVGTLGVGVGIIG